MPPVLRARAHTAVKVDVDDAELRFIGRLENHPESIDIREGAQNKVRGFDDLHTDIPIRLHIRSSNRAYCVLHVHL